MPTVAIRWVRLARPTREICPTGVALYQPGDHTNPNHCVVRLAVETGSQLSRSPSAPGSGDAASMGRSGHPAHDARVVGALFAGDTVRPGIACRRASARSPSHLVHQSVANDRRYAGFCSKASLARDTFLPVTCKTRYDRNSTDTVRASHRNARLCRVIWIKSSLVVWTFWVHST